MLVGKSLDLELGGKHLLQNVNLTLLAGERVAFVGHNGAGKSTLMGVLTGRVTPDGGRVEHPSHVRVGELRQEPQLDPESTVLEIARQGVAELTALIDAHAAACTAMGEADADAQIALGEKIALLSAQIDQAGGFDIDHRVERVLSRLGVRARDEKVGSLSGGERRRVDLARLMLSRPDVLLLDEPTNHLDFDAVRFLGEELKSSQQAVMFVTHDRAFLDEVATRILELDGGQMYGHPVPYAKFLESRLTRESIEQRSAHRRERMMARELAWLRAGTPARTTKQNARISRAEALIDQVKADVHKRRDRVIAVRKAGGKRLAKTILELQGVGAVRGGRQLFDGLDLKLVEGERWGIIGPNGAGKTTLLSMILGNAPADSGTVVRGKHTEVAVFDQHRSTLDRSLTVGEVLSGDDDWVYLGDERIHVISYMERFLFAPDDRNRPVPTLSGGEQNRLIFAKLFLSGANTLVLDEPTNDLDVTTLGVLEDALCDHQGVALIVSHDRAFLDRVCTGILAFEPTPDGPAEREIIAYQGDYTTYARLSAEKAKKEAAAQAEMAKKAKDAAAAQAKDEAKGKDKSGRRKKRSYKEQREYENIEERVFEAEAEKEALEEEMDGGNLYATDSARAVEVAQAIEAKSAEIDAMYARWQELEEIGG